MTCVRHSMKFHLCGRLDRHSFRASDVASTSPKYELEKVAFELMFLIGIKSQRFGTSSFLKFYYTLPQNPFATPRTVLHRAFSGPSHCLKIPLHLFLIPHVVLTTQIYQIRPSRHWVPSALNVSQFGRYAQIPEFPRIDWNRKSCGNVRSLRKRVAVRWKSHGNLKRSFGMNISVSIEWCVGCSKVTIIHAPLPTSQWVVTGVVPEREPIFAGNMLVVPHDTVGFREIKIGRW